MSKLLQFEQSIGAKLSLERMTDRSLQECARVLFSPTTWFVAVRGYDTHEKICTLFRECVSADETGNSLTVVARNRETSEVVAISRFHSPDTKFNRIEIGFTWIADKWQRTFVNRELKFLMLSYAFEILQFRRVEFLVDPENQKSNQAVLKIGAKFEGLLRKWRAPVQKESGDRNIYSIIDDEWASMKHLLQSNQTHQP